ncbi:hypothetical protein K437DRAFT_56073 [Tilletiaria anomala UBC 951]|uniref:CWH43-like N-terminal domain-containing protein n=1 Tax=Tilletiaria anomala (strain ATCC 24038 / CBS 436.72 / UBC 951) TaxID=1037660 RepID=A0A066WBQ3_TILAU|nr:uncharacterized protein K437DRAFT_56073 [Tilletiaria anomala UBC 951]KDN51337.1 hypothetical protein K437DRAFT_56073 [Tilletiaria anomala UBC 951]
MGLYWIVPLLCALAWLTNLVGLLGFWRADNFRAYKRGEADIVFVSDIGAAHHAFFIGLSCTTAGLYILTVLIERQLRHSRRIPGSVRRRTTVFDVASVIFAIIGSLGLIFLSIFDAFDYSTVHWSMTVIFVFFVAVSVLFQLLQVFELAHGHPSGRGVLLATAIIKAIILGFSIIVSIIFATLYGTCRGKALPGDTRCNRITSVAAICEWTVAFLLFFFFLTYVADFAHPKQESQIDEPQARQSSMKEVENGNAASAVGHGHGPGYEYATAADCPVCLVHPHMHSQATLANENDAPQAQRQKPR